MVQVLATNHESV